MGFHEGQVAASKIQRPQPSCQHSANSGVPQLAEGATGAGENHLEGACAATSTPAMADPLLAHELMWTSEQCSDPLIAYMHPSLTHFCRHPGTVADQEQHSI
mmetsp:Transcript_125985/g.245705  ORF Transcript_125985/g.245705 Transcript_125985/m.245705 type:complete len:102 (-) Transcript_125985:991-1296(-)